MTTRPGDCVARHHLDVYEVMGNMGITLITCLCTSIYGPGHAQDDSETKPAACLTERRHETQRATTHESSLTDHSVLFYCNRSAFCIQRDGFT